VKKVFENFDFSLVGQMQSLLESHGIETFLRNQYGSLMGELPFVEVVPQLFILDDNDLERALSLLKLQPTDDEPAENWLKLHPVLEVWHRSRRRLAENSSNVCHTNFCAGQPVIENDAVPVGGPGYRFTGHARDFPVRSAIVPDN
jgi:hypothetical protein